MSDEDIAALVVENGSGMCKVRVETFYRPKTSRKAQKPYHCHQGS